jgi:hypothetical protein
LSRNYTRELEDYNTVAERMAEFFEKYPEGSFQTTCNFTEVDGRWAAVVQASAYRAPDDPRPGQGLAYEFIPGGTPYTKDSELQNAETAAWGRSILAVGAADAKKGIASREEVQNRQPIQAVPANAAGRAALRDLCSERNIDAETLAAVFTIQTGGSPRLATNDAIFAFIEDVNSDAVTIG